MTWPTPCVTGLTTVKYSNPEPCTCGEPAVEQQYAERRRMRTTPAGLSVWKPGDWLCLRCHENRQTVSDYCAFCDRSLTPGVLGQHWFFDRDGEGRGPPVPVCNDCREYFKADGSNSPEWQEHVAEARLYERDPTAGRPAQPPPPTPEQMAELAWQCMTEAERREHMARQVAEADAVFGDG